MSGPMTRRSAVAAALLIAGVTVAVAARQASPGAGARDPATASVAGRVVDAATDQPVPGAAVRLTARQQPGQTIILTDGQGQFVFHGLAAGAVTLTATAAGYIVSSSTEGRVYPPSPPVLLGAGQHVADQVIRLRRYASIEGALTDEAGEPMVGQRVAALRRDAEAGGGQWIRAGGAVTDDRGQYRLDDLIPGQYIVLAPQSVTSTPASAAAGMLRETFGNAQTLWDLLGATTPGLTVNVGFQAGDQLVQLGGGSPLGRSNGPPPLDGRFALYPVSYFPGTGLSGATVIGVKSGEARAGVDWTMVPVPAVRVSGVLVSPAGAEPGVLVRLVAADAGLDPTVGQWATTTTNEAGRFIFPVVPAGAYRLRAAKTGGLRATAATPGQPPVSTVGSASTANLLVTVGARDLRDVVLTLRPGPRVTGRVVLDGTAERPTPGAQGAWRVVLAPYGEGGEQAAPAPVAADGAFAFPSQAPGRYTLSVSGPPEPWTLRSVTMGGRDRRLTGIDLTGGDVEDVILTMGDRPTVVTGTVDVPLGVTVRLVVAPADYPLWLASGRPPGVSASITVGRDGTFTLTGLPPGEYVAVAATDAALDLDRDAAFFDALGRVGLRLSLTPGERRTLTMPLVRSLR